MLYISRKLVLIFLGLMLLFAALRLLFILYHFSVCCKEGFGLLMESFAYAIPLDISTACYACILSLSMIILEYAIYKKIFYRIHQVYSGTIVFLATVAIIA